MRSARLVVALLAAASLPAAAQAPPACIRAREGEVTCMAGTLCACRFERGGQLTGRPDRFAWDCGPLRPSCALDLTIQPAQPWSPPAGLWIAPRPGTVPGR